MPWQAAVPLAAGSGALTDLAFPGVGWWWCAPLGIAVLVVVLVGRRPAAAAGLACLHGVAFMLAHLHWAGTYVGPVWLALVGLEAAFFLLIGPLLTLVLRAPGGVLVRAAGVGGVWVGVEALRARLPFGGFGWGRVAFSQADAPTLGLAALGGAPTVSFAVAVVGSLLALAALGVRKAPRSASAPAVAAAVVLLAGAGVPTPTTASAGQVRVAAVQGNVPRAGLDFNAERRAVLDNHVAGTLELASAVDAGDEPPPDLVVWPENASDIDPLRNADAAEVIDRAARAVGVPILVGTLLGSDTDDSIRNTTLVWDPVTGPGEQYVKRHPVPFGEYVPYREFFRQITTQVDLVRSDMVAGDDVGLLTPAGIGVGVLICFEVVDDDLVGDAVRAGAQVIAVQTNNATFGYTDESVQQLAMSRLRAVEHGRAVVHVSTVGVSGLIAPDGSVVEQGGHFTSEVLTADLPLRTGLTPATVLGAWPEAALSLLGVLVCGLGLRRRPPTRVGDHGRIGTSPTSNPRFDHDHGRVGRGSGGGER